MASVQETALTNLQHPDYLRQIEDWILWRDTYAGGRHFVEKYLRAYSSRETSEEFKTRLQISPAACFAQSTVDDVVNNLFQRMTDITREGGSESYSLAITGNDGGVDLLSSSMNYFMGKKLLPELLTMRKVGLFADMPPVGGLTLLEMKQRKLRPYVYMYTAEDILNWTCDYSNAQNEYKSLLLKETYNVYNKVYMMPETTAQRYVYMYVDQNDGFVHVQYFNEKNERIDAYGNPGIVEDIVLRLTQIPFVVGELPHSLLENVASYQIALVNLISSDINYCLQANYPFYTEQRDFRAGNPFERRSGDGTEAGAADGNAEEITVGTASGRAYPIGAERPGFVHPSSEPLKASMQKEEQLKAEIRLLINLAVTSLNPNKQASAESKGLDKEGLEAGLCAIGLELERIERRLAEFWGMYEGQLPATVNYPQYYNLKTDSERRDDSKAYKDLIPAIPSITFQKEVAKLSARTLIGHRVSKQIMEKVENEIDSATIIAVDPDIIRQDVEAGYLDKKNAAKARLYPENAVAKANEEHAKRLAEIAASQSSNMPAAGARGVPDASTNPSDGSLEKQGGKDPTAKTDPGPGVRGEGK